MASIGANMRKGRFIFEKPVEIPWYRKTEADLGLAHM